MSQPQQEPKMLGAEMPKVWQVFCFSIGCNYLTRDKRCALVKRGRVFDKCPIGMEPEIKNHEQ